MIRPRFERSGELDFMLMIKCLRIQDKRLVLLNPRVLKLKR